ncbi:MAG: hypothetical protein AB7I27_16955 [Bacteriovoracaceae bacterium]
MATKNISPHEYHYGESFHKKKIYIQTLSILLGCFMIIIGLAGILNPGFAGLHLSLMHSLMLCATGVLSIWSGEIKDTHRSYYICMGLGFWFSIHAVAGYIVGSPGIPTVGYDSPDSMLIKIAPGFLELGRVDHILHSLLAIFFFSGAYSWAKAHEQHGVK